VEGLIIATNRLGNMLKWFKAWRNEIAENDIAIFIMHDSFNSIDTREIFNGIKNIAPELFKRFVFNHCDVVDSLQADSWIIPEKTSACKSYVVLKAWNAGCRKIFCLDDDCLPIKGLHTIPVHRLKLDMKMDNSVCVTIDKLRPRGMPYLPKVPVMLSHGLWNGIPDIDAITQVSGLPYYEIKEGIIPRGALFPFSGMNWACNREVMPLMYFGVQGPRWRVDRFDDIWCGFIAKKVMDHLRMAVWSGKPCINHVRASDVFVNLEKEAPGYRMNNEFYEFLFDLTIKGETPLECMKHVGEKIYAWGRKINGIGSYWEKYGEAIQIWASLFEKTI